VIVISDALRRARTALGLDLAILAEAAGVDPGTLDAYETGAQEIPGDVLWRLSDTLGIPIEFLDSEAALERHLEVMAVRFRADQRAVPDRVRLAVARASSAAREYAELEDIAGRPCRYEALARQWPSTPVLPRHEIWKSGRALAVAVRERLGLDGPIGSMVDLVEKRLGALVLWQKLPGDFAGYAFCDEIHGPAVVLNVNGRNQNDLVRRFTLAHEVCHVLFDRHDLAALSRLDAYDDLYDYSDDTRDPQEVRANAFAIHLLAPEHLSEEVWTRVRGDVRGVMLAFGISFEAARVHLANYSLRPFGERITGVPTSPGDEWKAAESSELWYPAFDDIPIERRHAVAKLAFELWVAGEITTSRLREALKVYVPHDQLRELAELYLGARAA
jgi:Zn-dependent peptidase ImmA (M78 family)/transcriptional regulator with XRE-family HTH domain